MTCPIVTRSEGLRFTDIGFSATKNVVRSGDALILALQFGTKAGFSSREGPLR